MKRRTLTLILISIVLKTSSSHRCESFSNVTVTVYPQGVQPYEGKVSGCIERASFNETITQVYIKDQNIPTLWRDSIRNMKYLNIVIFEKNNIKVIKASAFRNLPHLYHIRISFEQIKVIPAGIFSLMPRLQIVKLNNNKINTVEDLAFGNVKNLEKLYCDHNDLRDWKKTWFTNSTKLRLLDFSHNKITVLPNSAFSDFSHLEEINFDNNELEVIEPEAFTEIRTLQYLGLKYNKLKSIHPRVFPNSIVIRSLAVDANYLTFLPKKMMVAVTVSRVSIDGNPWKCPCLDQVLFWLYQTNATVSRLQSCQGEDVPVCSFSSTFSKACWEVIEEEVISTYLDALRKIDPPLDKYCARLD